MLKAPLFIFLTICCLTSNCQTYSLSPERMKRIKGVTVRISCNGNNIGTGFIINDKFQILTCFHVIESHLNDSTPSWMPSDCSNITVTYNGWRTFFVKKLKMGFRNYNIDSMKYYDFAVIEPVAPPPFKFDFIKLGNWDDVKEGQTVYTCGYPLTVTEPFVSIGMLSSKVDMTSTYQPSDMKTPPIVHHLRYAYLDLTLNHGNSGSAIIAMGNSYQDDRIIGIADFIVNSTNPQVNSIVEKYSKESIGKDTTIEGFKFKQTLVSLAFGITNTTNGIGGCYSIEYAEKNLKD